MWNSLWHATALLRSLLAIASCVAESEVAHAQEAPAALPEARHLPALDLNTLALKSGSRFSNCPEVPAVREAACTYDKVVFDSPTGPDALISQAGRRIDMAAYGPGVSLGNIGGWRVNKVDVELFTSAVRGITQAHSLFLDKHAAGDTMGTYNYVFSGRRIDRSLRRKHQGAKPSTWERLRAISTGP